MGNIFEAKLVSLEVAEIPEAVGSVKIILDNGELDLDYNVQCRQAYLLRFQNQHFFQWKNEERKSLGLTDQCMYPFQLKEMLDEIGLEHASLEEFAAFVVNNPPASGSVETYFAHRKYEYKFLNPMYGVVGRGTSSYGRVGAFQTDRGLYIGERSHNQIYNDYLQLCVDK